ncbi:MAG TPA: Lrp/AsnC family transcriptional regulator [Burkholderiaceae bacterium]|nr:Lrp/AsnC family transcriptional regulator [Burkholderiaceae bacterium]HNB43202.1 Lrp/AsnC family transcriptional regulator [Burkholderiaceae bacterium]HNG82824.1 Lrp/AsnC family transcriptional regulator [Burkholderiaceae bacterium]
MNELSIDRYDLALLAALQRDGQATNAALGERAALSASQISRRIQRLEAAGVITGYAALLDAAALGLGVTAFAHVLLERHDQTRPAEFERQIAALPEVLECFSISGEADYLLRIVAPDLATFSDLMMKRLLTLPGVAQVKTHIALSKVKQTHELPLEQIAQPRPQRLKVSFAG